MQSRVYAHVPVPVFSKLVELPRVIDNVLRQILNRRFVFDATCTQEGIRGRAKVHEGGELGVGLHL